MLMDFCYYFISSGLLASALFSSYYYYDKKNAKQLIFNVSWKGTHAYFITKSYIINLLNKTNEATDSDFETNSEGNTDSEDDNDKETLRCYLFFDSETMNCLTGENYSNLERDVSSNNFKPSVIFLREETDMIKFRRIEKQTDENIDFVAIEKPFIQVELVIENEEFDLNRHLKQHYYKDNKILDKEFLLWFLNYYGYSDASIEKVKSGDYIIKIIDKNVDMFDLKPGNSIILSESGYEKV